MKEKYVSKVKVPFCVRVDAFGSLDREELTDIYRELGVSTPFISKLHKYDGVEANGITVDCWDKVESFGVNTTVYTLEELQVIIAEVNKGENITTPSVASYNDDTDTLAEDEYVGIASGETGSTDSVGSSVSVTANISFNVMIKGQTFTLTSDELKELYTQLCVAEGTLQDWSIGNE